MSEQHWTLMAFALWTKTVETSLKKYILGPNGDLEEMTSHSRLNFHKTTKIFWKNMTSLQNTTLLLAGFVTLS